MRPAWPRSIGYSITFTAAHLGQCRSRVSSRANYSRGQCTAKDEARALQCYRRAAELGSAVAMDNVGAYYAMGCGGVVDKVRVIAWYRRTATHDYVPAMNKLGVLYSAKLHKVAVQ